MRGGDVGVEAENPSCTELSALFHSLWCSLQCAKVLAVTCPSKNYYVPVTLTDSWAKGKWVRCVYDICPTIRAAVHI